MPIGICIFPFLETCFGIFLSGSDSQFKKRSHYTKVIDLLVKLFVLIDVYGFVIQVLCYES